MLSHNVPQCCCACMQGTPACASEGMRVHGAAAAQQPQHATRRSVCPPPSISRHVIARTATSNAPRHMPVFRVGGAWASYTGPCGGCRWSRLAGLVRPCRGSFLPGSQNPGSSAPQDDLSLGNRLLSLGIKQNNAEVYCLSLRTRRVPSWGVPVLIKLLMRTCFSVVIFADCTLIF